MSSFVTVEECRKRCDECELWPAGKQLCQAYNTVKDALQRLHQHSETPELRAELAAECQAVWAVSIANALHIGLVVHHGDALAVLRRAYTVLAQMLEGFDSPMKEMIARQTLAACIFHDASNTTKPESMN